jgi:hypothetical protein
LLLKLSARYFLPINNTTLFSVGSDEYTEENLIESNRREDDAENIQGGAGKSSDFVVSDGIRSIGSHRAKNRPDLG